MPPRSVSYIVGQGVVQLTFLIAAVQQQSTVVRQDDRFPLKLPASSAANTWCIIVRRMLTALLGIRKTSKGATGSGDRIPAVILNLRAAPSRKRSPFWIRRVRFTRLPPHPDSIACPTCIRPLSRWPRRIRQASGCIRLLHAMKICRIISSGEPGITNIKSCQHAQNRVEYHNLYFPW